MDAIVLTHDGQLGLAELVHKTYASLWPGNRLTFRVPLNGTATGSAVAYLRQQPGCVLVASAPAIGPTVRALLEGIADHDWVYWCIDDRFPTWLDPVALDAVAADLPLVPETVEEVKLLRWRERLTRATGRVGGETFAVQARGSRRYGFWHHHFVRAGTLRRVFLDRGLSDDARIDDVMRRFTDVQWAGRGWGTGSGMEDELFRGRAFVPTRPLLQLGEPLVAGLLTGNGLAELRRLDCEVPPYASTDRDVVYAWAAAPKRWRRVRTWPSIHG